MMSTESSGPDYFDVESDEEDEPNTFRLAYFPAQWVPLESQHPKGKIFRILLHQMLYY